MEVIAVGVLHCLENSGLTSPKSSILLASALREKLAELEHIQWSHWTKYMLNNLSEENIERWKRQIETPYSQLSEKEKDSDREWADKIITILEGQKDG